MRFILTVDVPDRAYTVSRPSVAVAHQLRQAADLVEMQVVVEEHRHVYNKHGVQLYEWQVEPTPPPEEELPVRRRA